MNTLTVRDSLTAIPITMTIVDVADETRCAMHVAADHCRRIDWIVTGTRATAAWAAFNRRELDQFAETEK